MLFGLIFFVPLLGMAIGAGMGALTGAMADVGIDDDFIRRIRDEITARDVGTVRADLRRGDGQGARRPSRASRWSWSRPTSATSRDKLREVFAEEGVAPRPRAELELELPGPGCGAAGPQCMPAARRSGRSHTADRTRGTAKPDRDQPTG